MSLLDRAEKLIDCCFAMMPRSKPAPAKAEHAHLIAHRGAHDEGLGIIENTQDAFQHALELGCQGIEFDIHASHDNVLMVHHDPTLTRICQQDLAIAECDFRTLREKAPIVPSLKEVIERFGSHIHLYIELKSPFNAQDALKDALKELTPCVDYHLLSLDEALFSALDQFPKSSLLLVPAHNNVKALISHTLEKGYGGVLGHYLLLTDRKIKTLKQANQIVGVGFVDSKYSLYRELNRGLEYIFTNQAAHVSQYLRALKSGG